MIHVACMRWPDVLEPVCAGHNKRTVIREAVRLLRHEHGAGLVARTAAGCSARITESDIEVVTVPFLLSTHKKE